MRKVTERLTCTRLPSTIVRFGCSSIHSVRVLLQTWVKDGFFKKKPCSSNLLNFKYISQAWICAYLACDHENKSAGNTTLKSMLEQ